MSDPTPKENKDAKKPNKLCTDFAEQSSTNKETIIMLLQKSNEALAPPNLLPYSLQLLPEMGQTVKTVKECLLTKGQDSIKSIAKMKGRESSKAISLLRWMCQFGEKMSEVRE